MEFREKLKFFSLWPSARKRREISGWVQWVKWCSHIGQQMPCWQTVAAGPFWPCFACPKLGDAGKTRVASKNRGCVAKCLQAAIFTLEQNPRERKFLYMLKIFSQEDFALKSKLFYRHVPTSGRQNTVKTAPQPQFVNKAFVALYVSIILPIGPIPISLFVFQLEAED